MPSLEEVNKAIVGSVIAIAVIAAAGVKGSSPNREAGRNGVLGVETSHGTIRKDTVVLNTGRQACAKLTHATRVPLEGLEVHRFNGGEYLGPIAISRSRLDESTHGARCTDKVYVPTSRVAL